VLTFTAGNVQTVFDCALKVLRSLADLSYMSLSSILEERLVSSHALNDVFSLNASLVCITSVVSEITCVTHAHRECSPLHCCWNLQLINSDNIL